MKEGIIYCEYSGQVREAFRDRGWNMWSCDLLPAEDGSTHHFQGDAYAVALSNAYRHKFAGLHWPCTFFANSGVRWIYGGSGTKIDPARFHEMELSAYHVGKILGLFLGCDIPFYFENPVMHHMARKAITERLPWFATAPRCTIQPWMFGHWETKRTCLWLHKLPPLVPTYKTEDECRVALGLPEFVNGKKNRPDAKCHKTSPGPNRGHERSRTLPGIAKAMAEQWSNYLQAEDAMEAGDWEALK